MAALPHIAIFYARLTNFASLNQGGPSFNDNTHRIGIYVSEVMPMQYVLSVRALPSTIDLDDELEAGDMPSSIYAHDQVVTQQITLRISEDLKEVIWRHEIGSNVVGFHNHRIKFATLADLWGFVQCIRDARHQVQFTDELVTDRLAQLGGRELQVNMRGLEPMPCTYMQAESYGLTSESFRSSHAWPFVLAAAVGIFGLLVAGLPA